MSEKIVIIESENCKKCFFCKIKHDKGVNHATESDVAYCYGTLGVPLRISTDIDTECSHDCPLPDLPEFKENGEFVSYTIGDPITEELAERLIDFGYNECLHEISDDIK